MDTVEALKAEAELKPVGSGSWRENGARLIWCGRDADGSYTFRNTVSAYNKGPKIAESEAARILASEGPWLRPNCEA
jgi:hypothetical protein